MIDVQQADAFYDMSMQVLGKPPLTATYDRRVLVPLSSIAASLSVSTPEPVTEAHLRTFAGKGWVTILRGAETEDDPNAPGLPLYAVHRLSAYGDLSAAGFTDAELAVHAEFEEGMIDALLATDELTYEDDDRAQLIRDLEDDRAIDGPRLANFDERQRLAAEHGEPFAETREALQQRLTRVDADLAYLRRLDPARVSDAERERLGRFAHRLRQRNEMVRAMLVAPHYDQMRQGYSFFIAFSQHGLDETGWYFRGIRWAETLRDPAVTEETSRFPLRVPGFVLEGGRITPTRTLPPDEYARLWAAADLDEYLNVLKLVWSEKECPQCRRPVRKDAAPTRRYCSDRCGTAHRAARHRKRHPDAVKRSQNGWRRGT